MSFVEKTSSALYFIFFTIIWKTTCHYKNSFLTLLSLVSEAKVRTVSDRLIDLVPSSQTNIFSLRGLSTGVYNLDVIPNTRILHLLNSLVMHSSQVQDPSSS
jgi:hypothetical protein